MNKIVYQENSDKDFSFYHYIDHEHYVMDFHSHNFVEVYLSISGGKSFILGDRIYEIHPQDLFVINPFDVHKTITLEDVIYERYVMEFQPSFAIPYSTQSTDLLYYTSHQGNDFSHCLHLQDEQFHSLLSLFREYETVKDDEYGSDVLRRAKFTEMMVFISRMYYERDRSQKPEKKSGTGSSTVTDILQYINDHYREHLDLETLATETGYSKYYICKLFKGSTGITINKYLIKCRMAHAKQLLNEGASVTDVCYRSGFNDLSHFIRTFKKETGMSPKKYIRDEISKTDLSHCFSGPEISF